MASAETEKQKVQEITEKLEQGLKEVFESEKYKSYLNVMSKFHNYSYNNTMLIAMQKPDASLVAGYKAWQKNFERHVVKGEKGIRILAPAPHKIKEEQDVIDPETQELMLDEHGKPMKEVVEYTIPAFRVVPVFDVSQTEGKELPELEAKELLSSVEGYQDFMQALSDVSPVPIGFEDIEGDSKGYFHTEEHRIAIQEGMSESQTVKTGVHEVAHAKLHDRDLVQSADAELTEIKDRNTKEVEAESVAYTVCQHFGIDTSDYSFGYIAGWSSGKDMKELKSSLDTIRRTASELITQIEDRIQELQRDRVAEQEVDKSIEPINAKDVIVRTSGSMGSEFEIDKITNMSMEEVRGHLYDMAFLDENTWDGNVQAYLEERGAELVPIMASNGLNEEYMPFYDLELDMDSEDVTSSAGLSIMQQAENYIHRMEFGANAFSDDERNLIINYAYKMDDMEKVKTLTDRLAYQLENAQQDVSLTVIDAQAEIDYLPDPMVGLAEMHEYGYQWSEMLPLTKERALELYDLDVPVLMLHPDNSESVTEEKKQLMEYGGMFGVERSDWNDYLAQKDLVQEQNEVTLILADEEEHTFSYPFPVKAVDIEEMGGDRTAVFKATDVDLDAAVIEFHNGFHGTDLEKIIAEEYGLEWIESIDYEDGSIIKPEIGENQAEQVADKQEESLQPDTYSIYQLKHSDETRDYRFMDMDFLANHNMTVDRANYDLVYSGTLTEGMTLDTINEKFNIDHPADFTGHSLSVSDIVVLHQNGEDTSHYVDSFGFKEVPDFMKEQSLSADKDKVSYYVIEDLATWANNSKDRSTLERFENLSEAMDRFQECRGTISEYPDDSARTTLGISVGGAEFDILHVRQDKNCLVQDFTQMETPLSSNQFLQDLQTIADTVGFDNTRVHREMTPEEVKAFVKERFAYQLKNGGLDDISLYMERFESLYEQGKMDNLMPSISQRQITEDIPIAEWENPYFTVNEPEELAVSVADCYISIQTCTDGYDYTIYDAELRELDGGVYDDSDISIHAALNEIVSDLKESSVKGIPNTELQGNVQKDSKVVSVDYEELVENAESVAQNAIAEQKSHEAREKAIVSDFKAKTNEMFHDIKGQTPEEIEQTVYAYVRAKMDEYDTQATIVDVVVAGSRCRGLESDSSDLDVIVEFKGNEREDDFFHLVHEDGLTIGGVPVDINPITEGKTGTLATYLPQVEVYLTEKAEQQASMETEHIQENAQHEKVEEQPKITVTLTVAECSEFHNLGEFHEGIESVDEALAIYNRIPPERMRGIRGIGINLHTEGTESYEDVGLDILTGHTIDFEILDYVPDIKNNVQAMALIKELSEKVENVEILGTFPEPVDQAKQLAIEIDQFSYDYDTYEYKDNVSDREAQLEMLMEDISNGQADYLQDFLRDVIEDAGLEENVRKAQELSQKLSEYKPLAKVEEMEEQNYNMVDNVLNNGAGEKKQEKRTERVSIKERLSQKKAEIEQNHKSGNTMIEKESEKKTEREI